MSIKIEFVVVEENGTTTLRTGEIALDGEALVATARFEPESAGPEHGILAAIAETAGDEGTLGRALEELVAWAFQLGRQHPLPPELNFNELSGQDPRDDRFEVG